MNLVLTKCRTQIALSTLQFGHYFSLRSFSALGKHKGSGIRRAKVSLTMVMSSTFNSLIHL